MCMDLQSASNKTAVSVALFCCHFKHRYRSSSLWPCDPSDAQHPIASSTTDICRNICTTTLVSLQLTRLLFHISHIYLPDRVAAICVFQLTIARASIDTADLTYDMCLLTVTEMITQCCSIVSACWPQLKPFVSWMRSNGLKLQDLEDGGSRRSRQSRQEQKLDQPQDLEATQPHPLGVLRESSGILITQEWQVEH